MDNEGSHSTDIKGEMEDDICNQVAIIKNDSQHSSSEG